MSKQVDRLLDPRGYQERPMLELAKRPSLEELKSGKILFYNITVVTDIINGFIPGYDLIARENERIAQSEKEQEDLEAASIQKSMDGFMTRAGYDIEADEGLPGEEDSK